MAERVALLVQLGQVLRLMAACELGKIHVFAHPQISMLCRAEVLTTRVLSFKWLPAYHAVHDHVAPPNPKVRRAKL